MVLHDDVHVGAHGFPDSRHTVHHHLDLRGRQEARAVFIIQTVSVCWAEGEEVDFDAVIAFSHRFFGVLHIVGQLIRVMGSAQFHTVPAHIAPTELELAGVSAQVVPALAAQQLVDGRVERLTLDVPQGDVQSGDAGKDHGAAVLPPEGGFVELVPDDLVVQRVHADDQLGKIPDHPGGGRGGGSVGQSGLAVAIDALVRIDAAEDGTPCGAAGLDLKNFYFCNFHSCLPFAGFSFYRFTALP